MRAGGRSCRQDARAPAATSGLQAAEIEPPYVLLGASFGGLFAYMYGVTYPKEVAGMVLLDASFPQELDLERYFPRTSAGTTPNGRSSRSRSTSSPPTSRPPAYEAVVPDHIANYVDRFSPGELVEVKSPHYMEAAVPERIVQELEKVIAKA